MNKTLVISVLMAYQVVNDSSLTVVTNHKTFEDCRVSDLDLNLVYIRDKGNELFRIELDDIIGIYFVDHMTIVGMKQNNKDMNKYNPKELNAAIKEAISRGFKNEGMYDCLMFMPENEQNEDGYVNAKRFGYNNDTKELDYLGCTDIMPWNINYMEDYRMDFVPGGVNIFRKDRQKFKVSGKAYCNTIIE